MHRLLPQRSDRLGEPRGLIGRGVFIALFTVLLLCVDYILQSRSSTPPNDSSAGPVGGPAPATCVTREATTLPSADPSKPDTTLRLFVVHPPFDGPPYWVVQRDTLDKPREFAGPQAKAHVMSYERYDNKDDAYQAYQEQVERHVAQ